MTGTTLYVMVRQTDEGLWQGGVLLAVDGEEQPVIETGLYRTKKGAAKEAKKLSRKFRKKTGNG